MQKLFIDKNDGEQRLDRFLKKAMPKAPKNLIYKSIRKKNITVDGKKRSPDYILQEGETVEVFFSDETMEKFSEDICEVRSHWPEILYEDEHVVLMKKPAGILTHGRGNYREDDMVKRLIAYLQDTKQYRPGKELSFTPAVCNRLDRNTSGILIGTKTAEALREINDLIRKRKVERKYLAILEGEVNVNGRITESLEKNIKRNKVHRSREGKETITDVKTLLIDRGYTLAEASLITGRTHQIRSHFASMGYPVAGDPKYGEGRKVGLKGQWLHNYMIGFPEEISFSNLKGEIFTCPPTEELEDFGIKVFGSDYRTVISRLCENPDKRKKGKFHEDTEA